jgi:hypothetical protein
MRSVATALTAVLLSLFATSASGQVESGDDSADRHEQLWFVPRFIGAVSVGGSLRYPFPIGPASRFPSTWEVTAGWRHFFDKHSRTSLRLYGTFGRGGLFDRTLEARGTQIGGGALFSFRGINTDWIFGSIGIFVDAAKLTATPPVDPFEGADDDTLEGWQVGVGTETTLGSLFLLDPYLFADTGANVSINRITLGDVDAWEAWARWTLRFEWAIPRVAD